MMTMEQAQAIVDVWHDIDEQEDDISIERLAAMVADRCGIEYGDVFEALAMVGDITGEVTT